MRTIRLFTPCVLLIVLAVFWIGCPAAAEEDDGEILFFYSESCPSCHEMKAELDELQVLNPELPLRMFEIDEHAEVKGTKEVFESRMSEKTITRSFMTTAAAEKPSLLCKLHK